MIPTPLHLPETLCLGGPLHGTRVHVQRPAFTAHSPSEGAHSYRRRAFGHGRRFELAYVHDGLSEDEAFAAYLALRGAA